MASSPFVSEEDLHAFVDGETDVQTNAVILAYLAASPIDAARVDTWRSQNELIRASFSKIEHEPIPLSLSLAPTRNQRTDTLVQFAPAAASTRLHEEPQHQAFKRGDLAKLCAAIGIAFAGGMIAALITPHISTDFLPEHMATVTTASNPPLPSQTLEIASLREKGALAQGESRVPPDAKNKTDIASKLFAGDFDPPPLLVQDLAALELSVTGFQVGTAPGDPALCLFLTGKADEPLTLCIEKSTAPANTGYHTAEAAGLRSVDWPEKAGHFALAGHLPDAALLDLSKRIHARIEASAKGPSAN